jgi:RNA polymerase sigma factor (sigma-70 family)
MATFDWPKEISSMNPTCRQRTEDRGIWAECSVGKELLDRARQGDDEARAELARRTFPALTRWARGKLPHYARRNLTDTDDLVQATFLRVLSTLDAFRPHHEGAFFAYLRKVALNLVRDEIRQVYRGFDNGEATTRCASKRPTPLQEAIGHELQHSYEEALDKLATRQREALVMRIEFGLSHQAIADWLGAPSANAARMIVLRAKVRLTDLMKVREDGPR